MYKVNEEVLNKFLFTQNIPKAIAFQSIQDGRPELFKRSIQEASKVDGLYLEFGVMSGGTTNQIAELIPEKTLYGFDSWKGITEDFSDIHRKGTWIEKPRIAHSNIELIVGFYQETLIPFLEIHPEKIAFIHNASSLYSGSKYLLDTIMSYNRLQVGTIIQFDNIFYREDGYWYQDEHLAWEESKKKYNIEVEYFLWGGLCHCSYKITKI